MGAGAGADGGGGLSGAGPEPVSGGPFAKILWSYELRANCPLSVECLPPGSSLSLTPSLCSNDVTALPEGPVKPSAPCTGTGTCAKPDIARTQKQRHKRGGSSGGQGHLLRQRDALERGVFSANGGGKDEQCHGCEDQRLSVGPQRHPAAVSPRRHVFTDCFHRRRAYGDVVKNASKFQVSYLR